MLESHSGRKRNKSTGALFEKLEDRQLMSAVPLASKIKVAMLVDGSGNALDSSRVTIQFSEGITLVDPTKLRLFGYGLVTATGTGLAQQKITIKITSAVAGADGNKIVLTTDRRAAQGRISVSPMAGSPTHRMARASALRPRCFPRD